MKNYKINLLFLLIISCAENIEVYKNSDPKNLELINFGTNLTLDVITWNIENYPKDSLTINYTIELINAMNVDIIALQEISNLDNFNKLINGLNEWDGYCVSSSSFDINLAFLYRSDIIINDIYEVDELNNYNFPRTPLLLDIIWEGERIILINNHYKCCGDNIIENVYYDEEYRRLEATRMIKSYINNNFENINVILLGDLNDELNDDILNNVFWSFINDSSNYMFVDINIANGSSTYWSYPSWPSHLDHILISKNLYDEFEESGSIVNTILIENYFQGGWSEYERYISDHRPVGLRLKFNP
tara:strand:- start:363 stop:1271 length:909 start_codon:yes stop_codon:yes gene_type:complete